MPPRKKAANAAPPAPTRSSTRVKAAAANGSQTAAAPSKGQRKRARPASDEEDDGPATKPKSSSKKAKKANDDEDKDVQGDDDSEDKPAKMVTVMKRGSAPVDPHSGKVDSHQVYSNQESVWDAMLNQTDVSGGQNKNKFYVIQLLHPLSTNAQCVLFTRWGRVGENGQTQVKGPWDSTIAINEFKKQFKSKTGVAWESRVGTVSKSGKYTWIERSFEDDDEKEHDDSKPKEEKAAPPPSILKSEVQDFCKLIFNTSIIDATLSSMNYDARKLPLGKLAKSTILNGFAALKILSEVISQPNGDRAKEYGGWRTACETLSSNYYSIIPHDFGRNRPIIISDQELLKKELELVDALGDMEVASKLIATTVHADADGNPINPLDAQFRSLSLKTMDPIDKKSKEYKTLAGYVRDSHGKTHAHISVDILNIYRVEREGESDAFSNAGFNKLPDGERLLLWHGSRTTNFAGILKQGLRIAPPEAPVNGYMFGKGVYFADMMSKSAGYCYPSLSNNVGILILCEVAVKPFYERTQAEYNADESCKKAGARATLGLGRTQPEKWKDAGKALGNDELIGCHMPDGPAGDVKVDGYLQYNEYIVYDVKQIRVKYLFMVKM